MRELICLLRALIALEVSFRYAGLLHCRRADAAHQEADAAMLIWETDYLPSPTDWGNRPFSETRDRLESRVRAILSARVGTLAYDALVSALFAPLRCERGGVPLPEIAAHPLADLDALESRLRSLLP